MNFTPKEKYYLAATNTVAAVFYIWGTYQSLESSAVFQEPVLLIWWHQPVLYSWIWESAVPIQKGYVWAGGGEKDKLRFHFRVEVCFKVYVHSFFEKPIKQCTIVI